MAIRKHFSNFLACTALLVSATAVFAQDTQAFTDGEVRKVDLSAHTITLKHGEIKNLDMPPMSMVFQVKDLALLANVKVGQKVKFTADEIAGALVLTDLQPAP